MTDTSGTSTTLVLSDKAYTRLKWITMIVLPASAALYFAFAQIWGLPKGEEVVGSIAALTTFLGALLGLSTKAYNNAPPEAELIKVGSDPDTGMAHLALKLHQHPDELLKKKTIQLKVDPNEASGTPPTY